MQYQKKISWFQQILWYRRINNIYNYYYLIEYKNQYVGLINGKDVDFVNRTCEGGIFIWDKNYWNTFVPIAATIILNDYNFLINNFKSNFAKVLKTNSTAINYNKSQGYKIIEEDVLGVVKMVLTKEDYLKKSVKIKHSLAKLANDDEPLNEKNFSFEGYSNKEMKILYSGLPTDIQGFINKALVYHGTRNS